MADPLAMPLSELLEDFPLWLNALIGIISLSAVMLFFGFMIETVVKKIDELETRGVKDNRVTRMLKLKSKTRDAGRQNLRR